MLGASCGPRTVCQGRNVPVQPWSHLVSLSPEKRSWVLRGQKHGNCFWQRRLCELNESLLNHIYTHIHKHTYTHMHTFTHIYTCTYTHTHTYTHTYTYTRAHIHTHTYIHTNTHLHTHTHVHTHVCIHINTYTHAHIHTHIQTHIHTHIHIHLHSKSRTYTHTHTHPEDYVNNDFIFPISTSPYLFVPLNPSGCRDLQEKWIKARNGALLIYLFIPRLVPDGILGGSLRWTM